jgi:lysophospholipase L1-like esterase
MVNMKSVLCYGDSNTWGADPAGDARFAHDLRWPGVLREALGDGWMVIEEGLCGRTTVFDDPIMEGRNGRRYLGPCLETHQPIDLVILMLGTNDLKSRFSAPVEDIAEGIGILGEMVLSSGCGPGGAAPGLLIAAPAPVIETGRFAASFAGAEEKSLRFAECWRGSAELLGAGFFDAGSVVSSSEIDGIHLDAASHRALGEALAAVIAKR